MNPVAALHLVWTLACPAQGANVAISMTSARLATPPGSSKDEGVSVPVPVREFVQTMRALASKQNAPYKERIIPENSKADLSKILNYVGPNGLEFVDFDARVVRDAQRITIRRISREHLAKQIQTRKGEQLLWLMEVAFYFKWGTDKPASAQTTEPGFLRVTFGDFYELTFRVLPAAVQLVRLKLLQEDVEGGV